jgi:hypothetical protein
LKAAILPLPAGNYVGLICVESPEVRFEDVISVTLEKNSWGASPEAYAVIGQVKDPQEQIKRVQVQLDPLFVMACEPGTIKAVSAISSRIAALSAVVSNDLLLIDMAELPDHQHDLNKLITITVTLSGIRAGRGGVRFPRYTHEEMVRNDQFWASATSNNKDGGARWRRSDESS